MYSPTEEGIFKYAWQYRNANYVEDILQNWKTIVQPSDTIIHIGDVIGSRFSLKLANLFKDLPGYKILIKGNHDSANSTKWKTIFDEVHDKHYIHNDIIYSHYPVNPLDYGCTYNIYGHLHEYPRDIKHSIIRSYASYFDFSRNFVYVLPDWNWSPVLSESIIQKGLSIAENMKPTTRSR